MVNNNKYAGAIRSMAVTGAAFAVNYGISLVLTPYLTDRVGTQAYGFVSLARQFAQYAAIVTAALDSFASRYITIEYHRGNLKQANVFFSSAFWGEFGLASCIMVIVAGFLFYLEYLLRIPEGIITDIKLLFLFVFVNFWITAVFSVFGSWVYIRNRMDAAGMIRGLSYVTEALVLLLLYTLLPARTWYVGAALAAAAAVTAGLHVRFCRKSLPELSVKRKDYSFAAVRRLVLDGVWTSVNSLGDTLNSGLDLVICNLMLPAESMGQLSIARIISSVFGSMFFIVSQSFQPMLLKSYAGGDRKTLMRELRFSMKISGMLSNVEFAGFAALGMAYYRLWIPNQDISLIYRLTLISILTIIPGGPMQPLYYIYTLTVKKKIPCLITIAGGICNVAAMFALITCTDLGIYAVAWTTAAVMAVIDFVTNPLYMAHVLGLPWHTFYPNIIRNLLSCILITGLFQTVAGIWLPDSWPMFLLAVPVFAAAGVPVHLAIVCDREDWDRVKRYVTERSRKRNA